MRIDLNIIGYFLFMESQEEEEKEKDEEIKETAPEQTCANRKQ